MEDIEYFDLANQNILYWDISVHGFWGLSVSLSASAISLLQHKHTDRQTHIPNSNMIGWPSLQMTTLLETGETKSWCVYVKKGFLFFFME